MSVRDECTVALCALLHLCCKCNVYYECIATHSQWCNNNTHLLVRVKNCVLSANALQASLPTLTTRMMREERARTHIYIYNRLSAIGVSVGQWRTSAAQLVQGDRVPSTVVREIRVCGDLLHTDHRDPRVTGALEQQERERRPWPAALSEWDWEDSCVIASLQCVNAAADDVSTSETRSHTSRSVYCKPLFLLLLSSWISCYSC